MKHINRTLFKGNKVETTEFNTIMVKTQYGAKVVILTGIRDMHMSENKPPIGLDTYNKLYGNYKLYITYDNFYSGYGDETTLYFKTKEQAEDALNYLIDLYNKETK